MKKILYLTNYAVPYRVAYFDVLGQNADVTVLFADRKEDQTHRSKAWFIQSCGNFRAIQLKKRVMVARGGSLCLDVVEWLKQEWDMIILCGYSSPTVLLATIYMRLHKIPFSLEVDGGLIRQESPLMHWFKKLLVGSAECWFSTGKCTTEFLIHYGANPEGIVEYPFSSLKEADLLTEVVSAEEKTELRRELGITEPGMILSIGQFIHRKGFDVLLHAAEQMKSDAGIYIVGGEPTEEYLKLGDALQLKNVHFCGFMKKDKLSRYYRAADLFVLPTREDIWGLVINEAMAYGLPVITTDRCVAGLELVEEGVNGYIVPVDDVAALTEKIDAAMVSDLKQMGQASLGKIRPYTIENMAKVHIDILEDGR